MVASTSGSTAASSPWGPVRRGILGAWNLGPEVQTWAFVMGARRFCPVFQGREAPGGCKAPVSPAGARARGAAAVWRHIRPAKLSILMDLDPGALESFRAFWSRAFRFASAACRLVSDLTIWAMRC